MRTVRTAPVVFSEADPHVMFWGCAHALEDLHRWRKLDADQPVLRAEIKAKYPDVNVDATAPPPAGCRSRRGN